MEFDLKEIEELSGAKAHVYSVVFEGEKRLPTRTVSISMAR